jgi:hypothetical protein
MFIGAFPELFAEPAKRTLIQILDYMKDGNLDKADDELARLESVSGDLPIELRMQIAYEKACSHTMRAKACGDGLKDCEKWLDEAATHLLDWFGRGENGAFEAIGRTASSEVHRMASDADLAFLLSKRKQVLEKSIPASLWPRATGGGGGGGGCVALGAVIDTPEGARRVEQLRAGDTVYSYSIAPGSKPTLVEATISAVAASRSPRCIRLNCEWIVTPEQPVRTPSNWIQASAVQVGDSVMDRNGDFVGVGEIASLDGYFEVFELSIEGHWHNYVANGLVCHNKYPDWMLLPPGY